MLELTWAEKIKKMSDGTERKFINDNDTVIMKGYCQNGQVQLVFEVSQTPSSLSIKIIICIFKT
jgi:hypothetical protein